MTFQLRLELSENLLPPPDPEQFRAGGGMGEEAFCRRWHYSVPSAIFRHAYPPRCLASYAWPSRRASALAPSPRIAAAVARTIGNACPDANPPSTGAKQTTSVENTSAVSTFSRSSRRFGLPRVSTACANARSGLYNAPGVHRQRAVTHRHQFSPWRSRRDGDMCRKSREDGPRGRSRNRQPPSIASRR